MRIGAGAAAALVMATACAVGRPIGDGAPEEPDAGEERVERVYARSQLDEAPELVGCAYEGRTRRGYWITVTFVVDATGAVDEASIAPTGGSLLAPRELVDRAKRIAATCRYEPGRIRGVPVRARLEKVFRLSRPADPRGAWSRPAAAGPSRRRSSPANPPTSSPT